MIIIIVINSEIGAKKRMRNLYQMKNIERLSAGNDAHRRLIDSYTFIAATEGRGELSIDGVRMLVDSGTVLFCNPGRMIEYRAAPGSGLLLDLISFRMFASPGQEAQPAGQAAYEERRSPWLPDGKLCPESPYRIGMLVKELRAIRSSDAGAEPFRQEMLLYELLHLLASGRRPDSETDIRPSRKGIELAIDYMHKHYREEISRDLLAQMTGFHPRFFSMLFKRETGYSFSDYLARIRIDRAKEQLLLTGGSLNDIARNVGYADGFYLSRKFKQVVGVSPTGYVREPKKIVVYDLVGHLLALGIKPLGASYNQGLRSLALLREELAGTPDVGYTSVEPMLQLKPELIIATDWLDRGMIEQLHKIAPTLVFHSGDPFERFKSLADILNRRREAEAFIARYEEKGERARAELNGLIGPDETAAVYEIWADCLWVMCESYGRGVYNLYKTLGFTPPAKVKRDVLDIGRPKKITLEELPDYAADHMFISVYPANGGAESAGKVMESDIWKQLPAVRRNRVYAIELDMIHSVDVLSLEKQLEIQTQLLKSALR